MRDEMYTERIDSRLTPEQKEKLKRLAGSNLSMNQVIRNWIDEAVELNLPKEG